MTSAYHISYWEILIIVVEAAGFYDINKIRYVNSISSILKF